MKSLLVSRIALTAAILVAAGLSGGSVFSQAPAPADPPKKDAPKDVPKDVVPDAVPKDAPLPKDPAPADPKAPRDPAPDPKAPAPRDPAPRDPAPADPKAPLPKDPAPADPKAPLPKDPAPADPKAPRDPATPRDPAPRDPATPRDPAPRDPATPRDPAPRDPAPRDPATPRDPAVRTDVHTDVRASARAEFRAADVRSADIGLWFSRATTNGLVINSVATRGPIAKLGFREGDRIISVNGQRVVRETDFVTYLFAEEVRRDRVKVIVFRDGREEIVWVEPAVLVDEYYAVQTDPLEEFGIILDDRYTDRIVVWRVVPRSPAYYAGIQAGDVLVTFRGQRIANPQQLVTLVRGLETGVIPVQVMRNRQTRAIEVDFTRTERRTVLRPGLDNPNDVERPNENREGRIEGRLDNREDRREDRPRDTIAPPADVPRPAVPAPVVPAPAVPKKPAILPRNR